jgi:hypothetical protein
MVLDEDDVLRILNRVGGVQMENNTLEPRLKAPKVDATRLLEVLVGGAGFEPATPAV